MFGNERSHCEFATSQSRGLLEMIQHSRVTRVRGEWEEYLASCTPSLREVLYCVVSETVIQ